MCQVYPKVTDDALLPDGSFITCGSDDTIRIWNINQAIGHNTQYKRNIYSYVSAPRSLSVRTLSFIQSCLV